MKREQPLPKGVPQSLKFGSVSFPLFATKDGRIGFRYKPGKDWEQCIRTKLSSLREDAERVALSLLNNDTAARDMSIEDGRVYVTSRELLDPLGLTVDRAARLLVDAARSAGGVDRVVEACRWFNRTQPNLKTATTTEVCQKFIRTLRADGKSAIYVDKMEQDLEKFCERFPGPISECNANDIDDWLLSLGIGQRRRRNLISKLRTAFNHARDYGALPESLRTETEKLKLPAIKRRAPQIYQPEEFKLVVLQCYRPADRKSGRLDYSDFIPPLTIGAFAGLRWAEILDLDWQRDVHFFPEPTQYDGETIYGIIDVGDENKTGHRQVPILPNLAAWLAPWRGSTGKVCTFSRPDNVLARLRRRARLSDEPRRYSNALRKSFVTYRMAIKRNANLVSEETGHSPAELKKSYLRRQLESIALLWFGFAPDPADNVLITPLFRRQAG